MFFTETEEMIISFITIAPIVVFVLASARGPHHPRDKVVKRHVHYTPKNESKEKITEDVELLHDKEHIQEHLEEVISEPDLSKMTDEELEFHYFQVHDTDRNSKLDGLEILQAILHTREHNQKEEDNEVPEEWDPKAIDYYVELIDQVLKEDDSNKDGYLSYPEYVSSRRDAQTKELHDSPTVKMLP